MLTSFHWLEREVYDGYVHTNIASMNPLLFLWKNKIFISRILILHCFIVSSLAHNFNQPLNPATTDVVLLFPRPNASIFWTEETLYIYL